MTSKGLVDFVVNALIVVRMMRQSKPNSSHHWHKMQFKHSFWCMTHIRRHDNEQLIFLGVSLTDVIDDGDVLGLCGFQIVGSLVVNLKQ